MSVFAVAGERPCERQLVLDASDDDEEEEVAEGVREWDGPGGRRCLGEGARTGAG